MDVETFQAIDSLQAAILRVETSLRGEIERVETGLRGEIERVETGLRGEIERVETSLRGEFQRVETSLRGEVQRVETTLRDEIGNLREQTFVLHGEQKRHTDVRFESLRDDIRMVAEGFAALSVKLDSLHPPR